MFDKIVHDFFEACEFGDFEMIMSLWETGKIGENALNRGEQIAASHGYPDLADYLLSLLYREYFN